MKGVIKINKKAFEGWLKIADLTQVQFAKEISCDEGQFSKIINGELEPSKPVIKKMCLRMGLGFDALLILDRDAEDGE